MGTDLHSLVAKVQLVGINSVSYFAIAKILVVSFGKEVYHLCYVNLCLLYQSCAEENNKNTSRPGHSDVFHMQIIKSSLLVQWIPIAFVGVRRMKLLPSRQIEVSVNLMPKSSSCSRTVKLLDEKRKHGKVLKCFNFR